MDTAQQKGKYSLRWARGIVKDFIVHYPRVTEVVNQKYTITEEMLATWIIFRPSRWRNYKAVVKRVDTWERNHHAEMKPELLNILTVVEKVFVQMDLKPFKDV